MTWLGTTGICQLELHCSLVKQIHIDYMNVLSVSGWNILKWISNGHHFLENIKQLQSSCTIGLVLCIQIETLYINLNQN